MTLEEQLRAYAAKGELVHLSVAFSNGKFHCNFAAATPDAGYSRGESSDPVDAIQAAFKASPAKRFRGNIRPTREVDQPELVHEARAETAREGTPGDTPSDTQGEKVGSLPSDWTTP